MLTIVQARALLHDLNELGGSGDKKCHFLANQGSGGHLRLLQSLWDMRDLGVGINFA